MTIRTLVNREVEKFRRMANTVNAVLAVLNNPAASTADQVNAMKYILGNNPVLWTLVFAKTKPVAKRKKIVAAAAVPISVKTSVTASPSPANDNENGSGLFGELLKTAIDHPGEKVSSSLKTTTPATIQTATRPARILTAPKPTNGNHTITLIGQFRAIMGEDGHGTEYWDRCRKIISTALLGKFIKSEADWQLLAGKMKKNLFFNGPKERPLFLEQCPMDILKSLLLAEDGLGNLVKQIRKEEAVNAAAPCRLGFVIEMCQTVGPEAKDLLINCKHAVDRMKQLHFILENHWLVKKVAAMKTERQASSEVATAPAAVTPEVVLAEITDPAPAPFPASSEPEVKLTAVEVPPEPKEEAVAVA